MRDLIVYQDEIARGVQSMEGNNGGFMCSPRRLHACRHLRHRFIMHLFIISLDIALAQNSFLSHRYAVFLSIYMYFLWSKIAYECITCDSSHGRSLSNNMLMNYDQFDLVVF